MIGTSFVMDTVVEYKLYGPNAQEAKDAIDQSLRDIENSMSMYIADSEISSLNKKAGSGEWTSLSEDTYTLLSRCVQFGEQSEGIFDVTIAPLTKEWGVTSDHPQVPEQEAISQLLGLVDYRDIVLDEAQKAAMLKRAGQAVDVGGIAKGYACDVARQTAKEYGVTSGYLSIGGNIMTIGNHPDGEPFKFGVRDPRGTANDYFAIVTLPDSTMATSGDYERYFEQDDRRYHHILDPRTGYPADSELMSVSVISPDGAYADYMSTYLFIMGKDFALQHLNSGSYDLIVVDKDKNVYISNRLKEHFSFSKQNQNYHFGGAS